MRDKLHNSALEQKGRSERLYLHYALALAVLLFLAGIVLTILGVGAHLDIIVSSGNIEGRLVNATPGVALIVIGAVMFLLSRPRPVKGSQSTWTEVHDPLPAKNADGDVTEGPSPQTPTQEGSSRPTRIVEQIDTVEYARTPAQEHTVQDAFAPPKRKQKRKSEDLYERPGPPSIKVMQTDLQSMRERREMIAKKGDDDALWMLDRDINDLEEKLAAAVAKRAEINAAYRDE